MALTRLSGVNHAVALQLYKELGDAQAVYDATKARLPWDEALHRRRLRWLSWSAVVSGC